LFSGYFGGSTQDVITSMVVDSQNNIVVAGYTSSADLPAAKGVRTKYAGAVDAFVASFSPNGGTLNFCSYLGGSARDQAMGVAVDGSRNIYLAGWTASSNFPLAGAIQSHLSGNRDAFITKLNSSGNSLIYSTYLGGSGVDSANAITVDSTGAVLVAGDTTSSNLPVVNALQPKPGGARMFL
jgi:hypothetical protein